MRNINVLGCVCLLPGFSWYSLSQAEITWMAGYIPRWFTHPQTVTHSSTSRNRRGVTSLIKTNLLSLSQTAT